MVKVILAENQWTGVKWCLENGLKPPDLVVVRDVRSLEGLRFRYEDVIRVSGWSKRSDIEEIEERILRTHVAMSHREVSDWDIEANLPIYTRDFLRMIKDGTLEYDLCTYGTVTH